MSTERADIMEALSRSRTITKAARRLGVARRTLQNRMRTYRIPEGRRGRPRKKIRYRKITRRYALPALVVTAVVGAGLLIRRARH